MYFLQTRHRLLVTLCLCAAPASTPLLAQAAAAADTVETRTSSATTNDTGPSGIVPLTKGFNASLQTSVQHDSSAGWASLLIPDLAYRFNQFLSVDASIPVYDYINVDVNKGTTADPDYKYETKKGVVADTAVAGHLDLYPSWFDYTLTPTLGLPSGNPKYGLGAGQVTYDINNHFEKDFSIFTPDIEIGIGDSSALIGPRIRRSYTAVGTIAHFQAGSAIELPFDAEFEADAYEELPIAPSTIFSTTGHGKNKTSVAAGETAAEDNGFLTSLDIPCTRHITLSGFYNRSLRLQDDIAGFSLTFLLRLPPRMDDTK